MTPSQILDLVGSAAKVVAPFFNLPPAALAGIPAATALIENFDALVSSARVVLAERDAAVLDTLLAEARLEVEAAGRSIRDAAAEALQQSG